MCLTLIWIAKIFDVHESLLLVVYSEHFIEQFKRNNLLFLYKDVIVNARLLASVILDLL